MEAQRPMYESQIEHRDHHVLVESSVASLAKTVRIVRSYEQLVGHSRELSLTLTKLEEAEMWFERAVAEAIIDHLQPGRSAT